MIKLYIYIYIYIYGREVLRTFFTPFSISIYTLYIYTLTSWLFQDESFGSFKIRVALISPPLLSTCQWHLMIGVLVISRLDHVADKFRGYIHTYVSFNLTDRISKAPFDLTIWQFLLCYEDSMRFPSLITISKFRARIFCSRDHPRWLLQKTLSVKQKMLKSHCHRISMHVIPKKHKISISSVYAEDIPIIIVNFSKCRVFFVIFICSGAWNKNP